MSRDGGRRGPARLLGVVMLAGGALGCGDAPRLGHVSLNAAVVDESICPTIQAVVAAPAQTSLGGQVALNVTVTAASAADTLVYAWSPSASIEAATSASATYTCASAGLQTVKVAITERDRAGACTVAESLAVLCVPGQP